MHLYTKFHQDRTILKEVRNFASRPFYIWRHSGHFECHKLPILKRAHMQGKMKPIVKPPYLYLFWFWRSSLDKISTKIQNGCCGGHFGSSLNVKMTQNQFIQLKDQVYSTLWKLDIFEKSPIMTSWRPSWNFYESEICVKTLRTPICTYILSFVKIGLFLRKLEIWRNAHFTYDVTAAFSKVVNFQL